MEIPLNKPTVWPAINASGAGKRRTRTAPWLLAIALLAAIVSFVVLAGSGSRFGLQAAKPVVPYPHELAHISFAVAGDVIPHEAVRAAAAAAGDDVQGWTALLSDVSDVFKSADFGFVNMETPVAPEPLQRLQAIHVRCARRPA